MARSPYQREREERRIEEILVSSGAVPKNTEILHTKVVGVMHSNSDGTSRQDAIGDIAQFDTLELVRNPDDEYDSNAIQVFASIEREPRACREGHASCARVQIGHLAADVAESLAPRLDAGERWTALASRVSFHISRGVSLLIFRNL